VVEDKQRQTKRTCSKERTERERREKVTMTADQSLRLGVVEHDGSTDLWGIATLDEQRSTLSVGRSGFAWSERDEEQASGAWQD
jgi:hypothetical protein